MLIIQANNHNDIRGGSETVFHETSSLLSKRGHEVLKLSFGVGEIRYKDKTFRFKGKTTTFWDKLVMFISGRYVFDYLNYYRYLSLFRELQPDLLHVHIFYGWLTNSLIVAARRCNVPVVMSNHEYRWTCPVYTHIDSRGEVCNACNVSRWNSVKKRCAKGSIVLSLANLFEVFVRDRILKIDQQIAAHIMVSKFISGHSSQRREEMASRSHVINNFIQPPTSDLELQDKRIKDLVYFGRISKEKGLETLFNCMSMLPDINLHVIGGGRLTSSTATPGNVILHGRMERSKLFPLVARCGFSVVPSEWYENNPMSVIESLSLGVPVIGARIGGIPEMIEDSVSGFLFKSGNLDDLHSVIKKAVTMNEVEYEKMSSNAIESFKCNYVEEVHYARLMSVYQKVSKALET